MVQEIIRDDFCVALFLLRLGRVAPAPQLLADIELGHERAEESLDLND